MELIVPVVKPVVRPLLATARPTAGFAVVLLMVPMSSMKPVASIVPGMSSAMAASRFELSDGAKVKLARTVATRQPLSINPG